MPLKRCSDNGKSGWKWGDQGKCYTGKEGKNQAIKQGISIEGPEKFAEIMKKESEKVKSDIEEYLNEDSNGKSITEKEM